MVKQATNQKLDFWNIPRKVFAFNKHDIAWIPNAILTNYEQAEFVVMPGGSDWNPAIYGEAEGKYTYHYKEVDIKQLSIFIKAVMDGKFIIGICRGAQLCCIGAGGNLIQHVSNHVGRNHEIITQEGTKLTTNSLHHQMLNIPSIINWKDTVDVVAYAKGLSTTYLNGNNTEYETTDGRFYVSFMVQEPEIAYFHKIKAFAIQGHPEMAMPKETVNYILEKIAEYYVGGSVNVWNNYNQIFARIAKFLHVYPTLRSETNLKMLLDYKRKMSGDSEAYDENVGMSLLAAGATTIEAKSEQIQTTNINSHANKKNRPFVPQDIREFN